MSEEHGNGWRDKYIINGFEQIDKQFDTLRTDVKSVKDDMANVKISVAKLKITAGLWGAAAGAVPTLAAIVYMILTT